MNAIVKALIRWSWLLVLCLIVGFVGGKALSAALPPTYQATTIVQLNADAHTSAIIQSVDAYAAQVTSDSLLNPLLQKYPHLDRQTFLTKELLVTPNHLQQDILIQVTLPDPKDASNVANTLAQLFVAQENAYIKSQYDKQLQLVNTNITNEKNTIAELNQKSIQAAQAAQAAPTNTTNALIVQQLSSQVSQHNNLLTQYTSTQQGLIAQQTLYSTPLSISALATPPSKPSTIIGLIPLGPLVMLILLVAALALINFLEHNAGRINSSYGLQQKTALSVLGSLRWTSPPPAAVPVQILSEAKTPFAEDCRVMMADILFRAEAADAHVLAVTGLEGKSGSSVIAAQLAALLAQSKRRVLLIDANFYEPSLHKRLNVSNNMGLARMLEETRMTKANAPGRIGVGGLLGRGSSDPVLSIPVNQYILPTTIQNLDILPSGKPTMNPYSLLSMPEMGQFLKTISRHPGHYIVIDCPALAHAEAHILASLSDQTFLVVDATRDRIKQVMNTNEELRNAGLKPSGLVVNKLGRWI